MQDFSGNTTPQDLDKKGMGVNSTVNFAILDLSGNDPTDPWGTGLQNFTKSFKKGDGSGALDTTAPYLYLYQVTNNQPKGSTDVIKTVVQSLGKTVVAADMTSWGYFDGLGLADAFGEVYVNNVFGNTRSPGNPAKANVGVNNPSVVKIMDGVTPSKVTPQFQVGNSSFNVRWANGIKAQERSVLFGFTSNEPPAFFSDGVLSDPLSPSFTNANGTGVGFNGNPFKGVPEPPSLTMMLSGVAMVSVFLVGRRARRRVAGAPAS
jgi:hypothetical protein